MTAGAREYAEHMEIIDEISNYEEWKTGVLEGTVKADHDTINFIKFLNSYQSGCTTTWPEFITKYRFVKHVNINNNVRSVYNIIPDDGTIMDPYKSYTDGNIPKDGYLIGYDFRGKILFKRSYNTLMLDYDYKDGFNLRHVINKLSDFTNKGKKYGINFVFMIFPSDRGVHAYLISHEYSRNYIWVDFLRILCNDAYYTAFSYTVGFNSRLNKKPDHPEDDVIWISPLQEKPSETRYSLFEQPEFDVDIDIPSIQFSSYYFNRILSIKLPNNPNIIGDKSYVDENLLINPYMDYILAQYMKNIIDTKRLESDIYDQFIYPFQSNLDNLRLDIRRLIDIITENITY